MLTKTKIQIVLFLLIGVFSCKNSIAPEVGDKVSTILTDQFYKYWSENKKEVNNFTYKMEQDSMTKTGKARLIFSVEEFSEEKQVISTDAFQKQSDKLLVLKTHSLTKIFDYENEEKTFMKTVYTPINHEQFPYSLKVTSSCQNWEDQSFYQLSADKKKYRVSQYTPTKKKGDNSYKVKKTLLEDELFNRIRINKEIIPTGNIKMIPGMLYSHMYQKQLKPKNARIRFEQSEATTKCIVEYLHFERTLIINFETEFPHKILSWTEDNGELSYAEAKRYTEPKDTTAGFEIELNHPSKSKETSIPAKEINIKDTIKIIEKEQTAN